MQFILSYGGFGDVELTKPYQPGFGDVGKVEQRLNIERTNGDADGHQKSETVPLTMPDTRAKTNAWLTTGLIANTLRLAFKNWQMYQAIMSEPASIVT